MPASASTSSSASASSSASTPPDEFLLRDIIFQLKSYYNGISSSTTASGTTASLPSQDPHLCYQRWLEGGSPSDMLLDPTTPEHIEEAFDFWMTSYSPATPEKSDVGSHDEPTPYEASLFDDLSFSFQCSYSAEEVSEGFSSRNSIFELEEDVSGVVATTAATTSGDDDEEPTAPCLSHVEPSEILVPQPQTQTRRQKRGREEDTGPEAAGPSTKKIARRPKQRLSQGSLRCGLDGCAATFRREAELNRHRRYSELHATRAYRCPGCKSEFTRPDAFARHLNDERKDGSHLQCRAPVLKLEGTTMWSKKIPGRIRDRCVVPFDPKVAPSEDG